MALTQKETDRLLVSGLAALARQRHDAGLRLNHPEAVALLTDVVFERARMGDSLPDATAFASGVLTTDDVLDGVAAMIPLLHIDALFVDGSRLVTLRQPIQAAHDIDLAPLLIPGEVLPADDDVIINAGLPSTSLTVENTSDLPVHLTAHMHIFEVNPRLRFNRLRAWGMRLDVPTTGSVRIAPGARVQIDLVPIGGRRVVHGFNAAVDGELDALTPQAALDRLLTRGFLHDPHGV